MSRRRNRLVLDLFSSAVGLAMVWTQWRRSNETDERFKLSPPWIAFGIGSVAGWLWLVDHDAAGLRRSRLRAGIVGVLWTVLWRRVVPDRTGVTLSIELGNAVGALCYRLYYGVLRPLPE